MPIDPKKRGLASADAETRHRVSAKGGSTQTEKTKLRGLASLSPERRQEISRKAAEAKRRSSLDRYKLKYEDLESKQ